MREYISGRRWFWGSHTLRLRLSDPGGADRRCPSTFILFYPGYVEPHAAGRTDQTLPNWLKGEGVQLVVRLVMVQALFANSHLCISGSRSCAGR